MFQAVESVFPIDIFNQEVIVRRITVYACICLDLDFILSSLVCWQTLKGQSGYTTDINLEWSGW